MDIEVTLTSKEQKRLKVLSQVQFGSIRWEQAAPVLGISLRDRCLRVPRSFRATARAEARASLRLFLRSALAGVTVRRRRTWEARAGPRNLTQETRPVGTRGEGHRAGGRAGPQVVSVLSLSGPAPRTQSGSTSMSKGSACPARAR
jgi:hypothetical protein